ncbi:MAG TPA: hypothetical protein VMF52_05515 [Steroidobacteraceae bacterium]|nr:hypothetical protein [Steroidobacteraceae bacterium]
MTNHRNTLLVTAVVALLPLAAVAAEGPRAMQKNATSPATTAPPVSFDALDANKDGRISLPEASADPKLVEAFSAADRDGDGYLDSSEYDNAARNPPK